MLLTGSISQAAVNLGRTQPAVSMTISTLEDLPGTRLFDRHAGRLTPRAEAQVLFEQIGPAATVLSMIENQRHDIGLADQGPALIRSDSPLFQAELFESPVCALFPAGLLGTIGPTVSLAQISAHPVCMLYDRHGMASELRAALPPPGVEFDGFFPMACRALASSVCIVDAITCATVRALAGAQIPAEART